MATYLMISNDCFNRRAYKTSDIATAPGEESSIESIDFSGLNEIDRAILRQHKYSSYFNPDLMSHAEQYIELLANSSEIPEAQRAPFLVVIREAFLAAKRGQLCTSSNNGTASNIHKLTLPSVAPKLYADRPKGQNIIAFLRENWGPYVEVGILTRPDFRRLDPQGEKALQNWIHTHGLPEELHIPTKKQVNDEVLSANIIPPTEITRVARMLDSRRRRGLHTPK